ncbi:actin patches distal protein 1 [Acrodontium crateriforme]|uniref:Actin patches distal protein 1 n=1 Tax=Acrodontium crateriforme TaxID=150365 RepID=A0AAQ3RD24_9PEZI|nr:actin patches distal protein 1 [Acrodontium crateriforme]
MPKVKMTSLLRSLTDRFTPNASSADLTTKPRPDGFHTAKAAPVLFTPTRPEVDGDDCLHDCATCTIKYPRKFAIEEEDKLYGEIKGFSRHLLVATGKTDWVRDVEDEKASVMQAVGKHRDEIEGGKLMLSATNIPTPDHDGEEEGPYGLDRPTRVLLLPSFQYIDGVTPNRVPDFIKHLVNITSTNTQPLKSETTLSTNGETTNGHSTPNREPSDSEPSTEPLSPTTLPPGLSLVNCPHKYLILLCSQATRDARCGQSAPLLRKELERHLRPRGLYRDLHDERPGGVGIYFISHVGGHKYSANMMVYRRADPLGKDAASKEAMQCIWLARVKPEDCENIVRYTVLEGKVVKPESQLRGGFDRAKGLVSW